MWQRQFDKERILERLTICPALTVIARAAPTCSSTHVEWRDWIRFVAQRAVLKKKELHGCWRAKAREAMLGAIRTRSDGFAKSSQRNAIVSWLKNQGAPRP
jgi:hypothetical protein